MKLLLWLVLYCTLAQGGRHNHLRNDNCLKRNRYKHESACRQYPRRNFYAFHRIIFDCIQVTTYCPRMYRHNEYNSLQECRDDCYFFMHMYDEQTTVPPKVDNKKKPDNQTNSNNQGSNAGKVDNNKKPDNQTNSNNQGSNAGKGNVTNNENQQAPAGAPEGV